MTAREVQVLARAAASFFDAVPMAEFRPALLPASARGLRRIRHRILHRTIHTTATGTLIRALLLGRDGTLRLFSARSPDSRDLLLILEAGSVLPVGVMRDVVDWTPTLRVPGFRPFEILEKLSHSLDAVEEQIRDAEARVQVQKAALTSGDLSALLPIHRDEDSVTSTVMPTAGASTREPAVRDVIARERAVSHDVGHSSADFAKEESQPSDQLPSINTPEPTGRQFLDVFDLVEKAAEAVEVKGSRSR